MKIHSYMTAIALVLLVSMPTSYAGDVPVDLGDIESLETGSSEEFKSVEDNISDFNIVDEPISFDYNDDYNNDDYNEKKALAATPIPAAMWLFATGLLGMSRLVKRHKKA